MIPRAKLLIIVSVFCLSFTVSSQTFNIDPGKNKIPISPYIYGINSLAFTKDEYARAKNSNWGSDRLGGNRMTGYNWENNFSNAGSDWNNQNDDWLMSNPEATDNGACGAIKTFLNRCKEYNRYPVVQLQMAGYVAADKNGSVNENAPSSRWKKVEFKKNGSYSLNPDQNDGSVYIDELLNAIVNNNGKASGSNRRSYCLDNEPLLWKITHSKIHPQKTQFDEVLDKSTDCAKTIRNIDPEAEIIGFETYGWTEMSDFDAKNGTGFSQYQNTYKDSEIAAICAFLAEMKKRSESNGKRLIDILGVHWYPEAKGDTRIVLAQGSSDGGSEKNIQARLQAPLSLWNISYLENSWISDNVGAIKLLPRLQTTISQFYPGTKLAITEWDFGGENHFSGGLATADVLGIFGVNNVYLANYHSNAKNYSLAAFKIFRSFDGSKHTFGDISISAQTPDKLKYSVYASLDSKRSKLMNVIVINKTNQSVPATFSVAGDKKYKSGIVYGFDDANYNITARTAIKSIDNNSISYTLPKYSCLHFILSTDSEVKLDEISPNLAPLDSKKASHKIALRGSTLVYSGVSQSDGKTKINLSDLSGKLIAKLYDGISQENQMSLKLDNLFHAGKIISGSYVVTVNNSMGKLSQIVCVP